jgi:CheY-like chemotaxis protein
LWAVSGDATQFYQVLMNLCVNARDAMPGGGWLTVAAKNIAFDENSARPHLGAALGPYVLLEVADTGTGIPAAIFDKIFDPFFTTKEPGKGTGLGLATTLGIVKSHGGFITVTSEAGKGTCFSVYLPAIEIARAQPQEKSARPLPCGHGELILVVDDEASIRAMTKATLEAYGYRVLTAREGREAVDLYAKHAGEIQAVLTDMMMPIMDGAATIRALQKLEPSVRIIAVSGMMDEGASDAARLAVQATLSKPYTMETLLTTLSDVLGSGSESGATPGITNGRQHQDDGGRPLGTSMAIP